MDGTGAASQRIEKLPDAGAALEIGAVIL